MLRYWKWGCKLFIFVGIIFLLLMLVSGCYKVMYRSQAKTVQGTIVEMVKIVPKKTKGESITYAPKIVFKTENGEVVTFMSKVSSSPPMYVVGQSVLVIYSLKNSADAEVDSMSVFWFTEIGLLIMGIGFIVLG
jgi:hypothetical protein